MCLEYAVKILARSND